MTVCSLYDSHVSMRMQLLNARCQIKLQLPQLLIKAP